MVGFGAGITVGAYTVDSDSQITASITISGEAALGTRNVSVTTPGGGTGTLTNGFTVTQGPPTITVVNPNQGNQGQLLSVIITGTDLTGATNVDFGAGIAVLSYTVDSDIQISADIIIDTAATLGARDVSVTTPGGGTGTLTNGFTVNLDVPTGGGGCFIATAAYGTPLASDLDILRDFRDQYLLTNPLGEALVEAYYSVSPPMADFIGEREGLRTVVRGVLTPVVAVLQAPWMVLASLALAQVSWGHG